MKSWLCKDFLFSHYSPQSGGLQKMSNWEIGPSKDQRILTESQKIPHILMTDQSNGTSAPHSYNETVNKKTKCTTKKPQVFLKFSSNLEVSGKLIKMSAVFFSCI